MFYLALYFLIQSRSYFTNTQVTTQLILRNIVIPFNLKLHNPNSVYHFCLLYQVSKLKRTLLFTVLQQMQEQKDSHRSDSTRLPRRDYMVYAKKCLLSHCKGRDSITINRAPCCSEDGIYAETMCTFVMTLPVEAMRCHC